MIKVSIVIPCFNSDTFVGEAIRSVLLQSYSNIELIVVDDGSTDRSLAVINSFVDDRLLVLQQVNQGACVARNLGLSYASGEYVKFLDADDVLVESALSEQIGQLELAEPGAIIFGYCYNFVGDISNFEVYPKVIREVTEDFLVTLVLKSILISCSLYPRIYLSQVGGFDAEVTSRQEWALNLKLLLSGYTFQYFDSLIFYRRLHDSEFRISNRKHQSAVELRNLDAIFGILPSCCDRNYTAAWSYIYWRTGRYILINEGRHKADVFFDRAKNMSPGGYKKYWPKPYRIVASVLGFYVTERVYSALMNFSNWLRYRKL